MTREAFEEMIREQAPVILDGATGTNLMTAGMPVGVCPEAWILDNPQVLMELQREYAAAGSQIVYAPTFTGNRIKLREYGLEDQLEEQNRRLVELSRAAVGESVLVAGNLTMTGQQLYPLGEMQFEELVDVYRQQGRALAEAGVDLFVVETMMSLQECRAAVIALREISELPIMVSLTYNEDGRTLFGTPPEAAVVVLQSLGADVIGINCSTGPMEMVEPVRRMAEYATIPILAKPNAGLPELENGRTVYRMAPEEFAGAGRALVEAGAAIVGGCCGTTPEHIRALSEAVRGLSVRKLPARHRRVLASERKIVEIALDGNFMVVGERINPTGKKKLQAQLREGRLDLVRRFAAEQEENGAAILDVNAGMNGIDEKAMMQEIIYEVTSTVDCPLCIDTSYVDVMEQALRIYPGRALINSISLESEKISRMLPLARKYGAMFILLPLSDEGLPKSVEEKRHIVDEVYARAMEAGLAHEDIIVDGLVATIGANPEAAKECFDTIAFCRNERKLPTICGLSNISFGLPERGAVNAAFLTMMIGKGLTMAIANPSQELLMSAAFASDMLLNRPESDIRYIEQMGRLAERREQMEKEAATRLRKSLLAELGTGQRVEMPRTVGGAVGGISGSAGIPGASAGAGSGLPPDSSAGMDGLSGSSGMSGTPGLAGMATGAGSGIQGGECGMPGSSVIPGMSGESGSERSASSGNSAVSVAQLADNPIYRAVLKGSKGTIVDEVKAALAQGAIPNAIINEILIPAIGEVGELFNKKKYFLPQLIGSANTMKLAIDYLEPLLERREAGDSAAAIVIATVEGDIHDIGKNLVALMLKNYGYRVFDLGKDVPAEEIVDCAIREQAEIIGLSALMTTTMMRMKDVVELAKEKGCTSRIIIGGACITSGFAEEIGADGYSGDAADCVKLVERLLSGNK